MKLRSIITMANSRVRLQFAAMERSLRAAGCQLPLQVIPYDDNLFDLPANASWWRVPEIFDWLDRERTHPTMRKYQCLTVADYQFTDADVIFLRDPAAVLEPFVGLVNSCTEWNKPTWTYTPQSARFFYQFSSTWQKDVFSTGQFALDRALYGIGELRATAASADFVQTCLRFKVHEQPGLNQLVLATRVPVTNLTLPPHNMESTWAGDYPGAYEHLWRDEARKPYLIHWAGPTTLDEPRPIHEIFYGFLTRAERAEWDEQVRERNRRRAMDNRRRPLLVRAWNRGVKEARSYWAARGGGKGNATAGHVSA